MSRIISKINGKLLALRSLWLSNGFASFGKTSRIAKGVTLVGGQIYVLEIRVLLVNILL